MPFTHHIHYSSTCMVPFSCWTYVKIKSQRIIRSNIKYIGTMSPAILISIDFVDAISDTLLKFYAHIIYKNSTLILPYGSVFTKIYWYNYLITCLLHHSVPVLFMFLQTLSYSFQFILSNLSQPSSQI